MVLDRREFLQVGLAAVSSMIVPNSLLNVVSTAVENPGAVEHEGYWLFKEFDAEDFANYMPPGADCGALSIVRPRDSVNLEREWDYKFRLGTEENEWFCFLGYDHRPYAVYVLKNEGCSKEEIEQEIGLFI